MNVELYGLKLHARFKWKTEKVIMLSLHEFSDGCQ